MERLQKTIAKAGIASRRKAEELIQDGKVKVNGVVVREMGVKVGPHDEIEVNGVRIGNENKVYYVFNKPKRTLSTVKDDRGRSTVMDYFDVEERIFPVGRLDYDTTGLLLMTNDGEFANKMMHPKSGIEKTYHVEVEGVFTDGMEAKLEKGIRIDNQLTLPAKVEILARSKRKNQTILEITIYEGRNREIRKMMDYFHCRVKVLRRIRYGCVELGDLPTGQYRKLKMYDVKKLMALANAKP